MNRIALALLWGIGGVALQGCGDPVSEPVGEAPPIPVARGEKDRSTPAETPGTRENAQVSTRPEVVDIEGVKFTIPAGWKRVDPQERQVGFISARYLIPVENEEIQLTFSTARGGIEANFDRWRGQFQLDPGVEPIRDRITLVGGEAHWLDLRGTFSAGTGFSAGEPESGVRMIGVGIPLGDEAMYLKLVGSESLVGRLTDALRDVVKSADLP
jgi:hypothetical protein